MVTIGARIRAARKARGYTLSELADRYQKYGGGIISANTIGAWERGEKRIYADQLLYLSYALECTVYTLYDLRPLCEDDKKQSDLLYDEMISLPQEERKTLFRAFRVFDGNTHTLIKFLKLYILLPAHRREEIAFMGLLQYDKAKEAGELKEELTDDEYADIEKGWRNLNKHGKHN